MIINCDLFYSLIDLWLINLLNDKKCEITITFVFFNVDNILNLLGANIKTLNFLTYF